MWMGLHLLHACRLRTCACLFHCRLRVATHSSRRDLFADVLGVDGGALLTRQDVLEVGDELLASLSEHVALVQRRPRCLSWHLSLASRQ